MSSSIRAAFDFGSGSFKLCIASINVTSSKISNIIYQEEIPISMGSDYYLSENGNLSDNIQWKGIEIINQFKNIATSYNVNSYFGIATEIFRKAKNGESYLNKIKNLGIPVMIVTQDLEAKLGYTTCLALSNKINHRPVVWDSGGASFQITYMNEENNLLSYNGKLGTSVSNAALLKDVLNIEYTLKSANPVTLESSNKLINILKTKIDPRPDWIKSEILCLTGKNSLFRLTCDILTILNSKIYTSFNLSDARYALENCCNKTDDELMIYLNYPNADVPAYIIPKLSLLVSVMEHLSIERVDTIVAVGSTAGLLIMDEFWNTNITI